jgi:hypothetical protein
MTDQPPDPPAKASDSKTENVEPDEDLWDDDEYTF